MVNLYLLTFVFLCIAVFIFGLIYPSSSELFQEISLNKVTKTTFISNRLKVVNKYHNGLFKKVVFIDKGNIEKRYYFNNYFKGKYKRIWISKNF